MRKKSEYILWDELKVNKNIEKIFLCSLWSFSFKRPMKDKVLQSTSMDVSLGHLEALYNDPPVTHYDPLISFVCILNNF